MDASALQQHTGAGATMGDSASGSHSAQLSTQLLNNPQLLYNQLMNHGATVRSVANSNSASAMSLPERVEGMIDLQTLSKIHEALCMSSSPEDHVSAAWIKEHYLSGSDGEADGGCAIRSTEGFEKLYNAYKRVRSLTNRAQDKWPFFDRKWKAMNAATVRRVAQGELEMTPPDPIYASLDSAPPSFVPFQEKPKSGHKTKSTSQNLPSQVATAMHPSAHESATSIHATETDQTQDESVAETTTCEVTQEQTTAAAEELEAPIPDTIPTPTFMTSPDRAASEVMPSSRIMSTTPVSDDHALPLTAAYEPIATSLDRLPASSTLKRKRDVNGTFTPGHVRGNKKQNRRGGKGGLLRKSTSVVPHVVELGSDVESHTPSTFDDILARREADTEMVDLPTEKKSPNGSSTRVTRRSTRLTAAETSTASDRATSQESGEAQPRKRRADSDVTVNGEHTQAAGFVEEKTATTSEIKDNADTTMLENDNTTMLDDDSAITDPTEDDLLKLALSHTSSRQPSTTTSFLFHDHNTKQESANVQKGRQFSGPKNPVTVEYFARVHTGTTSMEIPLVSSLLGDDREKLDTRVAAYVAWKEKVGDSADISFETWSSIYMLGR